MVITVVVVFFFQAEDGIRDTSETGVQTCALPICAGAAPLRDVSLFQSSSKWEPPQAGYVPLGVHSRILYTPLRENKRKRWTSGDLWAELTENQPKMRVGRPSRVLATATKQIC